MDQQGLDELEIKLNTAFRPHTPIDDPSYFFGRDGERQSLRQTAFSSGQHAVVYGEKGAGKTSLARVSVSGLNRIDVFCEKDSTFSQIMRDLVFKMRDKGWANLEFDYQTETVRVSGTMVPVGNLTGNMVKTLFDDKPVIVVFDEIDRLPEKTVQDLGEFVKSVATDKGNVTIILIGASTSEEEILKGHGSVFRNTKFIRLEKFTDSKAVEEITKKGGLFLALNSLRK